jgi:hypothetical protein
MSYFPELASVLFLFWNLMQSFALVPRPSKISKFMHVQFLIKNGTVLGTTYLCLPGYFTSSLDDLWYLIQCKYHENTCHTLLFKGWRQEKSLYMFGTGISFKKYFPSVVGWTDGQETHKYEAQLCCLYIFILILKTISIT